MFSCRLATPAKSGGALHARLATRRHFPRILGEHPSLIIAPLWVALGLCLPSAHADVAPPIRLAWNANGEAGITGYKLSYGTVSRAHSNVVHVGTDPSATITGLSEGSTYYFSVAAIGKSGLQSTPSAEISYYVEPSNLIPPTGWTLHYTDSEVAASYPATAAFDGNPSTFWHSDWKNTLTSGLPHEIQIDLGVSQGIAGFRYLPRQDSYLIGNIANYEFYVSRHGTDWGKPVASGTFEKSGTEKEVLFTPTEGRFIRLLALSEVNGGSECNVAELSLIKGEPAQRPVNQAPSASPASFITLEDIPVSVILGGSDPDGDRLTFAIVDAPSKGTLSGTPPNLTYTPAADTNGADSFTFRVNDGTENSALAVISLTITPVDDPPVAISKSVATTIGTPIPVTITATDKDSISLSFSIVNAPANGTLSGDPPNLTYTPAVGFTGNDSFSFRANDGTSNSATATVSIVVTAINSIPVATAKAVVTPEDTPVAVVLSGTDADNDRLTFTVVSSPTKGTLSGTPPNLTYIPAANFNGTDSFTYHANDGRENSAASTVSISVTAVNDAPVATSASFTLLEDARINIVLAGTDVDGDSLTYSVASGPTNGTLGGTPPALNYTPSANFHGTDSFTFRVNDGSVDSVPATISFVVTPVNDAPEAISRTLVTPQDTALPIQLTGSDVEKSALAFSIVSQPLNGKLSGTGANLTYQPNAGFFGMDSFTFRVNDGSANSAPATITIEVTKKVPFPGTTILPQTGWTLKYVDSQESFDAPATHAFDGNPATFWHTRWRDGNILPPPHEIQINLGAVRNLAGFQYLPRQDQFSVGNIGDYEFYVSMDGVNWGSPVATGAFTNDKTEKQALFSTVAGQFIRFRALSESNGFADTCVAELNVLQGTVANRPPLASAAGFTTEANTPLPLVLQGSDPDGNPVSYSITSSPAHGTLSGTPPAITYLPDPGYSGPDSFTFQTNDGAINSPDATIRIDVTPATEVPGNVAPAFTSNPIQASATEDDPFSGRLSATDANGDTLTFGKVSGPSWMTVASDGRLSGTPLNSHVGKNVFTVRVSDPSNASAVAVLNISVANTNDAPFFKISPLTYPAGTEKLVYRDQNLSSVAADPDAGDTIFYSKASGPEWLTISRKGALGGTPPPGSAGTNQFIVRVTDSHGASSTAPLQIKINANSLPLPWNLDRVGSGNIAGAARYKAGMFTVAGAGALSAKQDAGNFGWQTLTGNGFIVARVAKLDDSGRSPRVGVMIRESLAANSKHAFIGLGGNGNFHWLRRANTGGKMIKAVTKNKGSDKVWLKLVRKGDTITAYKSAKGIKWKKIGGAKLNFSKNCYIGLSVSSGQKDKLNTSRFSNVHVAP